MQLFIQAYLAWAASFLVLSGFLLLVLSAFRKRPVETEVFLAQKPDRPQSRDTAYEHTSDPD